MLFPPIWRFSVDRDRLEVIVSIISSWLNGVGIDKQPFWLKWLTSLLLIGYIVCGICGEMLLFGVDLF
jgi:hypothetical protein